MAKLADALDLGSSGQPYGFKSLQLHQNTGFMLGVFLLRDFVLSAPRYACEPILCGWRSFLCASTTSHYYAHSVLYKSLQLHQKMAMSMWHKPFFLYFSPNKGLERVGIADTTADFCCLSATNDGHPSFATPA